VVGSVEASGVDAVVGRKCDVKQVAIAHWPCMSVHTTQHTQPRYL